MAKVVPVCAAAGRQDALYRRRRMSGIRVRYAAEDVLLEDSDPLLWYGQAMVCSRDMAVIATGLHVLRTGRC